MIQRHLLLLLLGLIGAACGQRDLSTPVDAVECRAYPDGVNCVGSLALLCSQGDVVSYTDCNETETVCASGIGCAQCVPGAIACASNNGQRCLENGSGFETLSTCDAAVGQYCNVSTGECDTPCQAADASDSYLGCEYYAVITPNSKLFEPTVFAFAIVVSNPNSRDVQVVVERGAERWERTIAPHGIDAIELPWIDDLRTGGSGIFSGAAYHVTSTLPIAAYQFNPLEFRQPRFCAPNSGSPCYYSYTNDASLLLPTHALTGNYTVMSYPAQHSIVQGGAEEQHQYSASFFALVGTQVDTEVEVRFSAHAIVSGTEYAPGEVATFTLGGGDVLAVSTARSETCPSGSPSDSVTTDGQTLTTTYCNVSRDYDLTGTRIRSSAPVEVVGGNDCALVPKNKRRCDHLEEILFPEDAWGKRLVVSASQSLRGEPNVVRIISSADHNTIHFEPSSVHADATLSLGDILEFETTNDFLVVGEEEILVGQYLVAQWYAGPDSTAEDAPGDPSMSLAIPQEQFLDEYTFLAPTSFDDSYVNITTFSDADVYLDGAVVSEIQPIGSDGLRIGRIPISGGTHSLRSVVPFGIVVYGYAAHTSYMYPGGLNLSPINLF